MASPSRRGAVRVFVDRIGMQLGLIRTLRGLTPTFGRLDDEHLDELRIERQFSDNPDLAFVECLYWICSCRRVSLPATMRRPSRPRRGRNRYCGHRHH